jgi:hypothetical protein
MKNLLVKTLFVMTCLPIAFTSASDLFVATETAYSVTAPKADSKFEDTLLETEGFLKRFVPAGVEVKRKMVKGNSFEYLVTKRILGFPKHFDIKGSMTFERSSSGCVGSENAYRGTADFIGSEVGVTDTLDTLSLLVCVKENSSTSLSVRVKSMLFYKGKKFGRIIENIAEKLIVEQVDTIFLAVKQEVAAKK